jgi:anti-sigma B factor antagonist
VPIQDLASTLVDLKTARFGDTCVVAVSGELDLAGAEPLRTELDRVGRLGGTTLIVDLLGVPFLDSSALGVLAGTAKRLRAAKGRMILVVDDPRTLRVFQVTGLDRVFALERSLSAAIDAAVAGGKASH